MCLISSRFDCSNKRVSYFISHDVLEDLKKNDNNKIWRHQISVNYINNTKKRDSYQPSCVFPLHLLMYYLQKTESIHINSFFFFICIYSWSKKLSLFSYLRHLRLPIFSSCLFHTIISFFFSVSLAYLYFCGNLEILLVCICM